MFELLGDKYRVGRSHFDLGSAYGMAQPELGTEHLTRAVNIFRELGAKLDFQRAVLQRIPKISAHPKRGWRDLLFIADEYHAFATVGHTDPIRLDATRKIVHASRRRPRA